MTSAPAQFAEPFIPTRTDEGSPRLMGVVHDQQELLLYGGLGSGLGSSLLPLDRGNPGPLHVVRLRVQGKTVLVESLARDQGVGARTHLGLAADDPQRKAVDDAFATSIIAALPILSDALAAEFAASAETLSPESVVVDLGRLAAEDIFDLAGVVSHGARSYVGPLPDAVAYQLDQGLSAASLVPVQSSATALVLSGSLTFTTRQRPPAELATVLSDPRTFTIDQRIVLRRIPSGFEGRTYHPRSGTYGKRGRLPQQGVLARAAQLRQPAFRTDAPIRFSVDPGIPEPFKSAVLDGAGWWADAFESLGLAGVYSVEMRDFEIDPWSDGVNPIWWVHRGGRGWSMGHAVCDPATAEIVRGSVRLGSQRVEQLRMFFEALLAPHGDPDEARLLEEIEEALIARIRHLAAHEVGHALGFVHNYASTEHDRVSAMDYPHPLVKLTQDGVPTLKAAYTSGLGDWDYYIVGQNYGEAGFAERERAAVALPFLTDNDGHAPGAASPTAVPWTIPLSAEIPDALAALEHMLNVREAALARFGPGVAPADADAGELESRYSFIHLLHRFETVRVARLLGSSEHSYGLVGELGEQGSERAQNADAELQRAALTALGTLVGPSVAQVPASVRRWLVPPSARFPRGSAIPESHSRFGVAVEPAAHERAAVALVASEVFEVHRLNRLAASNESDARFPGVRESAAVLFQHATGLEAREALRRSLLHALAHPALSESARRSVLSALADVHDEESLTSRLVETVASGGAEALVRVPLPGVPAGAPL